MEDAPSHRATPAAYALITASLLALAAAAQGGSNATAGIVPGVECHPVIDHLEITQAIQRTNEQDPGLLEHETGGPIPVYVHLVDGRTTTVRTYVKNDGTGTCQDGDVWAQLASVKHDGQPIFLPQPYGFLAEYGNVKNGPAPVWNRDGEEDTFNLRFVPTGNLGPFNRSLDISICTGTWICPAATPPPGTAYSCSMSQHTSCLTQSATFNYKMRPIFLGAPLTYNLDPDPRLWNKPPEDALIAPGAGDSMLWDMYPFPDSDGTGATGYHVISIGKMPPEPVTTIVRSSSPPLVDPLRQVGFTTARFIWKNVGTHTVTLRNRPADGRCSVGTPL